MGTSMMTQLFGEFFGTMILVLLGMASVPQLT